MSRQVQTHSFLLFDKFFPCPAERFWAETSSRARCLSAREPAPGCRSALEPGRVGLKRDYDGYSWSSTIPSRNTNAHLLVFYYFLARQASKTPCGRSCVASRKRGGSIEPPPAGFAEKNPTFECRAAPGLPRGKASTRATLWVAVVQLTAHLQTTNRESSALRPPPEALRAWAHRPAMRSIATFSARSSAEFSPWQAGRLPLGRDALRLLLPASTPSDPSRAPEPKNCPAQRSRAAHLGDSFYFAKCEIVESLLRRGARWFERTGLKPGGRCLPAHESGLPGEKIAFVRALAEIDQTTEGCLVDFLIQQSRADRAIPTSWNCPQAGQAPLTPRGRAQRAFYCPFG